MAVAPALSKRTGQLSLDHLGTPLSEVTFCVIDIETTGASANTCGITEIAAAKYHRGRCVGTFQTLVNPGVPVPAEITFLTGITTSMVGPAPKVERVLHALREFVRDAVIVGHNVRFDLSFLNKALRINDWPAFSNQVVDTCRLARRLVREEVPNCKLGTLSRHFAFPNQPTHRALDDVRATADLLHMLLERAAGYGVLGLDDLLEMPAINRHPQSHKLHLTNDLPRSPGVYLFRDLSGTVLYVGKASNLRSRVRSYFSSDDRRKIQPMLRVVHRIDHVPCTTPLEAAVLEIRLIQREQPRFNRQSKFWTEYSYVRIQGHGDAAKVSTTRSAGIADADYLGPFPSTSTTRIATLALREAAAAYGSGWREALTARPNDLLAPLAVRMRVLANEERFEEAALLRDRAGTLARGIERQHKAQALRATGWMTIRVGHGTDAHEIRFADGRVRFGAGRPDACNSVSPDAAVPAHLIDELAIVATWIDRAGSKLSVTDADRPLAFPMYRMPRFEQVKPNSSA
jgi:DNA polymerase III subunit epsilon